MIRSRAFSPHPSVTALAGPPVEKPRHTAPGLLRNITANYIGTVWTAIMGPALVAVYIRFLGIEAYGLVGIMATLQVVFGLLDLGLSAALSRELARLSIQEDRGREARDLVRTMETLYWAIALGIALIAVLLAPFFATDWIHTQHLSMATTRQAFLIMGCILAFQFPFSLYSGGLIGLQRQVLLNGILVGIATARGIGTLLALWLIAPTLQVFFLWQLLVTVAQTGLTALFLWRSLPHVIERPRFQRALLRALWRFAAGMSAISLFSLLLMQSDKIILSRLLNLEQFGYYVLATVIASSLYLAVTPIFIAVSPRFAQLVASEDHATLRTLYHQSCQTVSTVMLPIAVVLSLFAPEILRVWTRNPTTVQHTHVLVSLLVIGTALNGLMTVPFALQIAAGWTKLTLYSNMIAVALVLPLLFWATTRYGAVGAAAIWIAINAGYVLISIQIMHTRLLRGEKSAWYLRDVGLPLVGALSVALFGRWLIPRDASELMLVAMLALVSLITLIAAAILTPLTQEWLRRRLLVRRSVKGQYAE